MQIDDFNSLVEQAYEAAFNYERELIAVYERAYARQTEQAATRFASQTVTAAWTPPIYETLSDGMNEQEVEQADKVRDEAAAAILAILTAAGVAASSREFMEAISQRAQLNFEQEILRQLRKVVSDSFDAGLSAEETAAAIRAQIPQVIPSSAEMLAQTELTALANERSIAAAQNQFQGKASKRWRTVGDGRVRATHSKAEGQTVPIDQPFSVGGSSLMYPGDSNGALRETARCRCRLDFTNDPTAVTASGRPDVSQLAMVAVYPTPDEAETLASFGTHPAETMHCTMVFLGDVNEIDMEAAANAVARVARNTEPMSGRIGGVGMFAEGDDGVPVLAIPNVSGLSQLRTRCMDALAAEGVTSPSEHDWVPHMTLLYADEPTVPDLAVIGSPLTFDSLSFVVNDERTDYALGTLVASAQEDTVELMERTHTVVDGSGNDVTSYFTLNTQGNTLLSWELNGDLPQGEYFFCPSFTTKGEYTTMFVPFNDALTASTVTVVVEDDAMEMACPDCGAMNDAAAQVCDQCGADMESPAEDAAEPGEEPSDAAPMADGAPWRCLLAVEGVLTEDGRFLDPGSIVWRDLPLTLMALDETTEDGHLGAKVAGRIDAIWRDGNEIWGSGVFNSDEFGCHIQDLVSNQSLRGNSVDLAILAYEYRNPETGEALDDQQIMDTIMSGGAVTFAVTEGVILASTVCPTPAIAEANIILASGFPRMTFYAPFKEEAVLTASAAGMAPLHPPSAWFDKPSLGEPTPLTITPEGRVFGHAALWNSCHIGEPSGPGVCVPPPRSGMNYEIFHHGACQTEEGHDVVVGQLTLGTLHAGRDLGWRETMEHYEHSGLAFADVHAYEDRFGIVVAGALRPDVPAEKVREAKAGALSGDWRSVIGRGLEFLAALVVNVPGFPIPRPEARIVASASGEEEILALVAAGMVEPSETVDEMPRREYLRKIRVLTQ